VTLRAQRDLFGDVLGVPAQAAGLFAEVVFDLPLDHAYTYAVPDALRAEVVVGKRVLVPFGKGEKPAVGFCVRVSAAPPARAVKEIRRVLDEEPLLTADLLRLTRWIADYYLCGWGQVLNSVVPSGVKRQAGTRSVAFVEAVAEAECPQSAAVLTPKQSTALERLRAMPGPVELRRLAQLSRCGLGPVEALVEKGLARQTTRRVEKAAAATALEEGEPEPAVELNGDQIGAWSSVDTALRQGGYHAFLLHGVTGSGKTEVYLRAVEEVIRQGKQALVLVPEISLTPQTIRRFQGRCGDIAVLHSHLGVAERGAQWRRVARGEAQVVVGARSAVFAPTRRLGLIVVDEEHEGSFKQEATPRYHARDVAVMRARLEDIPVVLASATPSLESWHNAHRGQYTLLSLPNRVLDRPLPRVSLIDLRHEAPSFGGRPQGLSHGLEQAMHARLREGGQVMLLLNRRGFSTHVHCPACGVVATCRFCDLALTFHRQREVLLCHYCAYEKPPTPQCLSCGRATVRYQGLGTEKLQAEIESKFPGYVVRRMDSDTMRRPGSHARVLAAFRQGLIHILVGTQMIAKGLDFPNVTLVGVVNADIGLHVPDFRSAERTFHLLSQVAGRAGRGPRGGQVLVQTFNPEHPSIALAAAHDYARFVRTELAHRQAYHYPPFCRLIRLIVRGKDAEAAAAFAQHLGTAVHAAAAHRRSSEPDPGVRILGPAEAPVFRLKGYYRYHLQIQSTSAARLHELLQAVLERLRTPSDVEFTVDVDPLDML
jgi:primosomal protein N' (replication factor Y)